MALEDRIRSSVDQALQALVSDLVATSQEEVTRQTADAEARLRETEERLTAEFEQAEQRMASEFQQKVAEVRQTEERLLAEFNEKVSQMREEELRAQAEVQTAMQASLDRQLLDGQQQAEQRLQAAIADAEARALTSARESVDRARSREREVDTAGFARLLESVRGLDGATSLSEVMDALAAGTAREAGRAAVVVIKGDHIQGWRLSGFGARDAQPKLVDLAVMESGVIGLAASAGRVYTTRDPQGGADGPGFETVPAEALGIAVPVLVGGRVVAVVYADSALPDGQDRVIPAAWAEVVEILTRHAGRCLEALTAQKAAGGGAKGARAARAAEGAAAAPADGGAATAPTALRAVEALDGARRLARLLVSEIRLYHEPAVTEGRQARNLLARLGPEIARAREVYDARVSADVRTRTDVFQQELVRTLAGGDASLLGAMG